MVVYRVRSRGFVVVLRNLVTKSSKEKASKQIEKLVSRLIQVRYRLTSRLF